MVESGKWQEIRKKKGEREAIEKLRNCDWYVTVLGCVPNVHGPSSHMYFMAFQSNDWEMYKWTALNCQKLFHCHPIRWLRNVQMYGSKLSKIGGRRL